MVDVSCVESRGRAGVGSAGDGGLLSISKSASLSPESEDGAPAM